MHQLRDDAVWTQFIGLLLITNGSSVRNQAGGSINAHRQHRYQGEPNWDLSWWDRDRHRSEPVSFSAYFPSVFNSTVFTLGGLRGSRQAGCSSHCAGHRHCMWPPGWAITACVGTGTGAACAIGATSTAPANASPHDAQNLPGPRGAPHLPQKPPAGGLCAGGLYAGGGAAIVGLVPAKTNEIYSLGDVVPRCRKSHRVTGEGRRPF